MIIRRESTKTKQNVLERNIRSPPQDGLLQVFVSRPPDPKGNQIEHSFKQGSFEFENLTGSSIIDAKKKPVARTRATSASNIPVRVQDTTTTSVNSESIRPVSAGAKRDEQLRGIYDNDRTRIVKSKTSKDKPLTRVSLYQRNLILDCPLPSSFLDPIRYVAQPGRVEFTHQRYSVVTCIPLNFGSEKYVLRPHLYTPRRDISWIFSIDATLRSHRGWGPRRLSEELSHTLEKVMESIVEIDMNHSNKQ
jgi:chitin synthase-like protein